MYLRIFPIENGDIPASYVGLSEGMLNHLQKSVLIPCRFCGLQKVH